MKSKQRTRTTAPAHSGDSCRNVIFFDPKFFRIEEYLELEDLFLLDMQNLVDLFNEFVGYGLNIFLALEKFVFGNILLVLQFFE